MARILVVEDNADVAAMVCEALQDDGHSVVMATCGQDAVIAIDREPMDAIITDLRMPMMNGTQFVRHIRTDERFPRLPIILVSAYGEIAEIADDIDAFLPKPFKLNQLTTLLNGLLSQRSAGIPAT